MAAKRKEASVEEPVVEKPVAEKPADVVVALSLVSGDACAVLQVNDTRYALTPVQVADARRLFEACYYELH